MVLENMVANNQLEFGLQERVKDTLLARHRHLNEKRDKSHHEHKGLPLIRSLADIGKKYSLPRDLGHHNDKGRSRPSLSLNLNKKKKNPMMQK